MRRENEYVAYLQRLYPELQINSVYINEIGQNNDKKAFEAGIAQYIKADLKSAFIIIDTSSTSRCL